MRIAGVGAAAWIVLSVSASHGAILEQAAPATRSASSAGPGQRSTSRTIDAANALAQTEHATAVRRLRVAFERERETSSYVADRLRSEAGDAVRRLDVYRSRAATLEPTIAARTRTLYRVVHGGIPRLLFERGDDGEFRASARVAAARDVRMLVKRQLRELAVHERAEQRAIAQLAVLGREAQAVSALHTLQGASDLVRTLEQRALGSVEDPKSRRAGGRAVSGSTALKRARAELERAAHDGFLRRGSLFPPVAGVVRGRFGWTRDPELGVASERHGIELQARRNERVVAPATGTCKFAGNLPGFGQAVVLDHGHGFHSLIAHLVDVRLATGEVVQAGKVIGRAAPAQTRAHAARTVYFELRHGERPIDPTPYLRRGSGGGSAGRETMPEDSE